jgi:hypothetical protein
MTTCKMTDVQKILLNIVDGPVHTDACGHEAGSYQFTVEHGGTTADVYLYDGHTGGHSVCIRYSSECSAYASGPLAMWIRGLHGTHGIDRIVVESLLATNVVRLTPRKKPSI